MLEPAPDEIGQRLFVRRVGVGVEEADRDRLVASRGQCRNQRAVRLGEVERGFDRAVGEDAFGHLEAVAGRHDRRRLLVGELEHEMAVMTLDGQYVPESAGGDEGHPRTPALQHGVRRQLMPSPMIVDTVRPERGS